MADDPNALTPAQQEKVLAFLKGKSRNVACSNCFHIMFHAAAPMGIATTPPAEPPGGGNG